MDANELADRPYKLYEQDQERLARFIQPGDTLSIYVSGLAIGEPPVIQAGTRTPIAGFPVIVSQENTIFVPNLGTFETKDKDLEQLKEEIVQNLVPQVATQVNVAFLLRHNQQLELRNVTGTQQPSDPIPARCASKGIDRPVNAPEALVTRTPIPLGTNRMRGIASLARAL